MKIMTLAAALVLSVSPSLASEKTPHQQLDELTSSYSQLLALTYGCQDAVGVMFYQGAQASAIMEFGRYVDPETAKRVVLEQDATLAISLKETRKHARTNTCLRMINEAYAKMPK